MRVSHLVLVISLAIVSPAVAQTTAPAGKPDPVEVRNLAANYELTNADSTLTCAITLETKSAGRGLYLDYDRNICNRRFGFLGEVSSWLPGVAGAILLIASDGRVVTEFTEGVGGVYEAIREGDGVYFFANLQFVDPAERVQIADLFGAWILSRPNGPEICRLAMSEDVAGDELFELRVEAGCDAAIAQTGLATWQLQRGDIVLRSRNGDTIRFERHEGNVWSKIPEKPQPLVLSRPQ